MVMNCHLDSPVWFGDMVRLGGLRCLAASLRGDGTDWVAKELCADGIMGSLRGTFAWLTYSGSADFISYFLRAHPWLLPLPLIFLRFALRATGRAIEHGRRHDAYPHYLYLYMAVRAMEAGPSQSGQLPRNRIRMQHICSWCSSPEADE